MNEKFRLKLRQLLNKSNADSVSFKVNYIYDDFEGRDWPHTDIIVNGESILEKIKKYEVFEAERTSTDEKLAGNYVGIDPSHLITYFYSRKGIQIFAKKNFTISISQCGKCMSRDCTSHLYCECKITPLTIEFSNFRQEFTPVRFDNAKKSCLENIAKHKWNYEAFGPFKFPKGEFLQNLRKVI